MTYKNSSPKSLVLRKALVVPIQQDDRFDDLLSVWRRMVTFCAREAVRIGSYNMLRLQRATYARLREMFPDYNSQIVVNAYKFASEAVKGCVESCRSNKRTRFPNVSGVNSVVLRKQDVGHFAEGARSYVKIIYKPFERIVARIHPSDWQKEIMAGTTPKGARLVRRNGRWMLHAIVEKAVTLSRWERCTSVVDVGRSPHAPHGLRPDFPPSREVDEVTGGGGGFGAEGV